MLDLKEILISAVGIPDKDEICTFEQYVINEEEKEVLQINQQDFRGIIKNGLMKSAKGSCSNKFVYLQNIVDNKNDESMPKFFFSKKLIF